jgi:hypothetical protein
MLIDSESIGDGAHAWWFDVFASWAKLGRGAFPRQKRLMKNWREMRYNHLHSKSFLLGELSQWQGVFDRRFNGTGIVVEPNRSPKQGSR